MRRQLAKDVCQAESYASLRRREQEDRRLSDLGLSLRERRGMDQTQTRQCGASVLGIPWY